MKKSKKNVLISVVMAALLVFLDQLTKFLAVVNLKNPGKVVEIIPNVFEFRYLENQSAAFGIDLLFFSVSPKKRNETGYYMLSN